MWRGLLPVLLLVAGCGLAGQPGKHEGERAGLVGREASPSPSSPAHTARDEARMLLAAAFRTSVRPNVPRPSRTLVRPPISRTSVPESVWDRLVDCESPGRGWRYGAPGVGVDPGYDYEGGPNFTRSTWLAFRLPGMPEHAYDATREQQIAVAERVLAAQGVRAWPVCGPKVGLHR